MRIVINTKDGEFFNIFSKICKDLNHHIINAKVEAILFENVESGNADAFILEKENFYFKKAVDFIKKNNPYVPVIGLLTATSAIDLNTHPDFYTVSFNTTECVNAILYNIDTYNKTFATLKKLTAKMRDKIEFNDCMYDPVRRILYHKGKEIKKLSAKEGGILEILASNYGQVVKKDVILEKVWRETTYWKGRSMDVYITYLRNTLKNNDINLSIKNISGIGLILE